MRELTSFEIDKVCGGVGPVGAVLGGAAGGISSAANGGNAGQIVASTIFGAASGFFGGIAGATSGVSRYLFGAYSVEMGVLSSSTTS